MKTTTAATVITDPEEMRRISEETAFDDEMFGTREFPTIFFPNSTTVGAMMAALYWPKGHEAITRTEDEDGVTVLVRCKPEYVPHLIEETIKAGGGFLSKSAVARLSA